MSVLDHSVIAALKAMGEDDPTLFGELVDLFIDNSLKNLTELKQALAASDAKQVERIAHTFKSSCANMGASELSDLCVQLERLGRAGTLTGADQLFARVTSAYGKVQNELQANRS
jgi:HPt (histidine-containing phosphotransfer) domain-containing protein